MKTATVCIGSKEISNFGKTYVIAELGANHNGDLDLARRLIDEAKAAGADCAKFQSWSKQTLFSKKAYQDNCFLSDDYRNRTDYTLESIVEAYSLSEKQLIEMRDYCDRVKIDFASTPFSNREADFLVDTLKAGFIKVASMDVNNFHFLDYMARKGKPMVLSTGLSTLSEIDEAIRTIENAGNRDIVILHCVANYPPKDENVHLNNIDMLRALYPEYPIGFSDHTLGIAVPLAAITKGACILEKHFTLDKNMPGWDHKVSATPAEMKEIVEGGKKIKAALGSTRRVLSEDDQIRIPAFRRSIVAAKPIKKGQKIEPSDIEFKRPGTGIEPRHAEWIVGRTAKRDISFDELLRPEDI